MIPNNKNEGVTTIWLIAETSSILPNCTGNFQQYLQRYTCILKTCKYEKSPNIFGMKFCCSPAIVNIEQFKRETQEVLKSSSINLCILQGEFQNIKLAVFDMDSTLIQQEVIDELARYVGKYDEISNITREAMEGKLDFAESLRKRVTCLKGVDASAIEHIKSKLMLNEGVAELILELKKRNIKTAVLSGGFLPFIEHIQQKLGLDYGYGNILEIVDGKLTGHVLSRIVGKAEKAELLLEMANNLGISKEQIIAVGDGANDLMMLRAAGIGVAFNAKQRVAEQAPIAINHPSMLSLQCFLE